MDDVLDGDIWQFERDVDRPQRVLLSESEYTVESPC
jgi:hypothetical protein